MGYILNKNEYSVKNAKITFICYDENNYILGIIKDETDTIKSNGLWQFNVRYDGKVDRCVVDEFKGEEESH